MAATMGYEAPRERAESPALELNTSGPADKPAHRHKPVATRRFTRRQAARRGAVDQAIAENSAPAAQ